MEEGYEYAVCIGLERFFDTVNQSYLIELLSHTITDGRVISLIHKYLYAGVMVNGVYQPTTEGTPQGGPLSPLLSNIVLNELDKELERRGLITGSSASSRNTPDVRLPDGGNPVDAMAEK